MHIPCVAFLVFVILQIYSDAAVTSSNDGKSSSKEEGYIPNIMFIIRTQDSPYHRARVTALQRAWAATANGQSPKHVSIVGNSNDKIVPIGDRIPFHRLDKLLLKHAQKIPSEVEWIFVCEDTTWVDLPRLVTELQQYSAPSENVYFFAHGLHDVDAVVQHSYTFGSDDTALKRFLYPALETGWVLSRGLLQSALPALQADKCATSFWTDSSYQLTQCLSQHIPSGYLHGNHARVSEGPALVRHLPTFCLLPANDCITKHVPELAEMNALIRNKDQEVNYPRYPLTLTDLLFGISTHPESQRPPFLHKTWARSRLGKIAEPSENEAEAEAEAPSVDFIFFSTKTDPSLPAVNNGVRNVEKGFCGKTERMMQMWGKYYLTPGIDFPKWANKKEINILTRSISELKPTIDLKAFPTKKWFIKSDDDSFFNAYALLHVLENYDPDQPWYIGEVYGYLDRPYITTGGGAVISRAALRLLLEKECRCGVLDSPDDMHLGGCMKHFSIPVIHEPGFHQDHPASYPIDLLQSQILVSFHRMDKKAFPRYSPSSDLEPLEVYKQYLSPSAIYGRKFPKPSSSPSPSPPPSESTLHDDL